MKRTSTFVAILMATSCAMTPERFSQQRLSLTDVQVCRASVDAEKSGVASFNDTTQAELERRSISNRHCRKLIKEDDEKNAATAVAILAVAAVVVAAAAAGGGGGSSYSAPSATQDYDWDWDQFYNASYQLVWACRGLQTGQFAELRHCSGDYKSDSRWPAK
jgi:hypothetical protein